MFSPEILAWQAKLNKESPGTVVPASDIVIPSRFPSGSLALDAILGGGWPANHWGEVSGIQSSGKTATVFKTIAANQAANPEFQTFWLAAEDYDTDQATALGVNNSRVMVANERRMEVGLDYVIGATESREFDAIIVDSYPALLVKEEEDKSLEEFIVAAGARKFNQFWRKIGQASTRKFDGSERPFIGIIINQQRDKIGWSPGNTPLQTTPGGHGKDYSYYVSLKVSRDDWIVEARPRHEKPVKIGQTIAWTTTKNKSAPPGQTAKTDFYFRDAKTKPFKRGDYDLGKEYVTMGMLYGIVEQAGAWFRYGGEQWQGKEAAYAAFAEDETMRQELAAEVLNVIQNPHLMPEIPDKPARKKRGDG